MADDLNTNLSRLTATIVSAYIAKNHVAAEALPNLIQSVYRSLATVGAAEPAPAILTPAVPVRKSVFPDYIICLEDGERLKTLRRHLQTSHGMTPEQYRDKWKLPNSYPLVAPSYASRRATIAKQIGLGQRPESPEPKTKELDEQPNLRDEPPVIQGRARRARGSRG